MKKNKKKTQLNRYIGINSTKSSGTVTEISQNIDIKLKKLKRRINKF